ncbi:MAG: alkaline phosphatase family protein [Ktedonobacterales bacterium]
MYRNAPRERAPRVMIIGLDGATFTWLRPLIANGRLPHLGNLLHTGASGELTSIIPPHTGPAWPSMVTGRNPGKHGVFYFERYNVASYDCLDGFTTSETLVGRTIFDSASVAGLRVAALRVPMTYPVWQINGVMTSGFPAPADPDRSAYPRSVGKVLPPMGKPRVYGGTPESNFAFLTREIETLTNAACAFLASDDFDLFMAVYQQTDQAHHFFWHFSDPSSPLYSAPDAEQYGDLIPRVYAAVDAAVGKLLEYAGDETLVLVVSDHGAECAPHTYFQVNQWLRTLGLLHLTEPSRSVEGMRALFEGRHLIPKDIRRIARRIVVGTHFGPVRSIYERMSQGTETIDWGRTDVYRFPVTEQMEGLALNVVGRQPQGTIQPGAAYEELRERVIAALRALRVPGSDEPLVTEVYRREEVFSGPHSVRAPDVLYRLAAGYESRGSITDPLFIPVPPIALSRHSAWHDRAGVLLARGAGIAAGTRLTDAHLLDIAPTVLRALGLPLSADLDGHPLQSLLFAGSAERDGAPHAAGERGEAARAAGEQRADGDAEREPAHATALSSEEEEGIRERLEALGYL